MHKETKFFKQPDQPRRSRNYIRNLQLNVSVYDTLIILLYPSNTVWSSQVTGHLCFVPVVWPPFTVEFSAWGFGEGAYNSDQIKVKNKEASKLASVMFIHVDRCSICLSFCQFKFKFKKKYHCSKDKQVIELKLEDVLSLREGL